MPGRKFPQSEIAALIKRGRKQHSRHSWLRWAQNSRQSRRIAFAISRRHAPSSVKRNLIKRHHREAARALLGEASHCDVIVFGKPTLATMSSAMIRADALALWKNLEQSLPKPPSG